MDSIVAERIIQTLVERFEAPVDTSVDTVFEDLDLDSISLVELSLSLQKQLGVLIEEGDLKPDQTVREAAELLSDKW